MTALSAALLFFDFGARVFTTNDETRFAVMARDILAHGHWLRPEINGVPMLNKPPLHAWLIAFAAWPGGAVTQRTAALPSLLAGLGVVITTYWIGRRLFDADVGLVAGLIAVTTAGVFALARSPVPDMVLSLVMSAAIAVFVMAEFDKRRGALLTFYLLLGIAFWVKGPAGLLPLAVALVYVVVVYRWAGLARLASVTGLAALLLVVGAWCWLAFTAGGSLFVDEVVTQDMGRAYFVSGSWGHGGLLKPAEQALSILLPWSLALPIALWSAVREGDPTRRRAMCLVLVWATVLFLLVAVSHRQRWRYHLPLCVPAALLLGLWLRSVRWPRRTAIVASIWIVVAVAFVVGQVTITTRATRATNWRTIARETGTTAGPLFALNAPEIVFEFYLQKPVVVTPDYSTFARLPQAKYLLMPRRGMSNVPAAAQLREVADGVVAGHDFVLLMKR